MLFILGIYFLGYRGDWMLKYDFFDGLSFENRLWFMEVWYNDVFLCIEDMRRVAFAFPRSLLSFKVWILNLSQWERNWKE